MGDESFLNCPIADKHQSNPRLGVSDWSTDCDRRHARVVIGSAFVTSHVQMVPIGLRQVKERIVFLFLCQRIEERAVNCQTRSSFGQRELVSPRS